MSNRPLLAASRKELNQISLDVKYGNIPADLHGFVFICTTAGTVNTNGLPYESQYPDGSTAQEYGTPITNGDGLIIKLDLSKKGKVLLSTDLVRTPCYYADEATMRGTVWHQQYGFMNAGLLRISNIIGVRGVLNFAIRPVKFAEDLHTRLLLTSDVGRPFELDPHTLRVITPIGKNKEWQSTLLPFDKSPFPLVLTAAHPTFDPHKKEFFTINFIKEQKKSGFFDLILNFLKNTLNEIDKYTVEFLSTTIKEDFFQKNYLKKAELFVRELENRYFYPINPLKRLYSRLKNIFSKKFKELFVRKNAVYLIKWCGKGALRSWQIVDEQGKPLKIEGGIHQVGCSKDYIIFADIPFNFTSLPLPYQKISNKPGINNFLYEVHGAMQKKSTDIYWVHRSELRSRGKRVRARKITVAESILHFSNNYENPDGTITLYAAHHACTDLAEWVRPSERLDAPSQQSAGSNKVGLPALVGMDAGKVVRIVIDAPNGVYLAHRSRYYCNPCHTWGIGLCTYRHDSSANRIADHITHMYWQSCGLRADMLPADSTCRSSLNMGQEPQQDIPFAIFCLETKEMTVEDFYIFDKETYFWSLQFVPRNVPQADIPPDKDGYIFTTVVTDNGSGNYQPEIWIFDASALSKGPICKLYHPDVSFGFTTHTAWTTDACSNLQVACKIDIQKDYEPIISRINNKQVKQEIAQIFKQYVYPNF